MRWSIEFQHEFETEIDAMDAGLQEALLGRLLVLAEFGPGLGEAKGRYAEWLNVCQHERAPIRP